MKLLPLLAALACVAPGAALAQDAAMSPTELDAQRGGLRTPLGLEVGFGAVVSTFVDKQLALRTRLTWTEQGPVQTTEDGKLDPDVAAKAAEAGIGLPAAADLQGVVVPGDAGATAVVHSLDDKRIASLVLNTASDRDIRQATDITLDIP